jgi:hypothetical protein
MKTTTARAYPLDKLVDARIADLKLNEWNPRTIAPDRLESLKRSLEEDPAGLRDRPLIALPDGTVIAGNMRLTAAIALGWESIPVVFHEYDEAKARQVALRDNNPWGDWDDQGLAELLKELEEQQIDLDLTGFTADDIESRLIALAEMDLPPLDPEADDDRGTDLALADVSIGDPVYEVASGEVWSLGPHVLVVEQVYDGWQNWVEFLTDEHVLFVPYPTPTLPLTVRANSNRLVMVQPDPWLAGHVLDKYAAVRGEDQITKLR